MKTLEKIVGEAKVFARRQEGFAPLGVMYFGAFAVANAAITGGLAYTALTSTTLGGGVLAPAGGILTSALAIACGYATYFCARATCDAAKM